MTSNETQNTTLKSTAQDADQAPKKVRITKEEKFNILREHISAGHSVEDIQRSLGLSMTEFSVLFFELTQTDGRMYKIPYSKQPRKVKVGSNGSFIITANNIERMGLDGVFVEGSTIQLKRDGNLIIASVVIEEQGTETKDAKPVARPVLDATPCHEPSLSDSDEEKVLELLDMLIDSRGNASLPAAPLAEEKPRISAPVFKKLLNEYKRLTGKELKRRVA